MPSKYLKTTAESQGFPDNALEILKNNSVFWSKLGFCYDPPRIGENGKPITFFNDFTPFCNFHKQFAEAGIHLHTSILFSGWVDINIYDYSLTDQVLDHLFAVNPDIYYIPRIKLNPPHQWCRQNPEDVCVYYEGPRDPEEVRKLIWTEKHDILGYDSIAGYYTAGAWKDNRPNVGGVVANQSFSSKKVVSIKFRKFS